MRFCLILLVIVATACRKDPELWKIENLNNNEVSIFGHGGMGIFSRFPMDSYESIQEAFDIGADGTEMDIQMTKDSVLVVFHHNKLEDVTSATGAVYERNWEDIRETEFKSLTLASIKLMSLDGLFKKLKNANGKIFTFECKLNAQFDKAYFNHFANRLIKHIKDNGLMDHSFIESTDTTFIRMLYTKEPKLKLFYYTGDFSSALKVASKLPLYGLTFNMNIVTANQIKEAHQKNLRVTLFDQKSEKDNLNAIQMSPDFIQTDKLEHVLKVFEKYK